MATWAPPSEFGEQLRDLYGLTCPPRWGTPRNLDRPTYGPRVARILELLGTPAMPWQRYVLDVGLEIDPATGLFVYRDVGLSVPRQQGKTKLTLGLMVHRIAAWKRQNVYYAAQTRGMARDRLVDEFLPDLEASPLKGRFRPRLGMGHEAIIWTATRSRLTITSNTEKAGHGPPLDLGLIDEAFAHEDDRLEQAFNPAMITRPMAQKWWASAGGTEKSHFLNRKRAAGRELIQEMWATGRTPSVAYFEWYPDDDADRADPETWRSCMPALGITISESIIRSELETLEPPEFDRAYLNRTRVHTPPPDPNIPAAEWPRCEDESSRRAGDVALAVDVTPGREFAAIGLVGPRADDLAHVEVIDHRSGTDWLPQRLAELKAKLRPVGIGLDGRSPAASLIVDLAKVGVTPPADGTRPRRGDLVVLNTTQAVQACGQMTDAVRQLAVRHIGQAPLNTAIAGARTRPVGDAWMYGRRAATVDISPLMAVTFARWVWETRAPLVLRDYDPLAAIL